MERIDIIDAVGREYHTANIENGEFSYPKAFKEKNLDFEPIHKKKGGGSWQFLDIRFELDGVSLLIETKNDADKWPTVEEQIAAYVEYEKRPYWQQDYRDGSEYDRRPHYRLEV